MYRRKKKQKPYCWIYSWQSGQAKDLNEPRQPPNNSVVRMAEISSISSCQLQQWTQVSDRSFLGNRIMAFKIPCAARLEWDNKQNLEVVRGCPGGLVGKPSIEYWKKPSKEKRITYEMTWVQHRRANVLGERTKQAITRKRQMVQYSKRITFND